MSSIKQALESAIESLLVVDRKLPVYPNYKKVIRDCKSALAELESVEPVLKVTSNGSQLSLTKPNGDYWDMSKHSGEVFYTSPQPREWVGLSDEQVGWLTIHDGLHDVEIPALASLIRAVEAKLKELNTKG